MDVDLRRLEEEEVEEGSDSERAVKSGDSSLRFSGLIAMMLGSQLGVDVEVAV